MRDQKFFFQLETQFIPTSFTESCIVGSNDLKCPNNHMLYFHLCLGMFLKSEVCFIDEFSKGKEHTEEEWSGKVPVTFQLKDGQELPGSVWEVVGFLKERQQPGEGFEMGNACLQISV